jgi:hypothetical protein
MNPYERETLISVLVLHTGQHRRIFDRMDDDKLELEYRERVENV